MSTPVAVLQLSASGCDSPKITPFEAPRTTNCRTDVQFREAQTALEQNALVVQQTTTSQESVNAQEENGQVKVHATEPNGANRSLECHGRPCNWRKTFCMIVAAAFLVIFAFGATASAAGIYYGWWTM